MLSRRARQTAFNPGLRQGLGQARSGDLNQARWGITVRAKLTETQQFKPMVRQSLTLAEAEGSPKSGPDAERVAWLHRPQEVQHDQADILERD